MQHLALFVPWEDFLSESNADVGGVWERYRESLTDRLQCVVNNAQLLRQSAEDAKRDARQRAAASGEGDPSLDVDINVHADGQDQVNTSFRSDEIGDGGVSDRPSQKRIRGRTDNSWVKGACRYNAATIPFSAVSFMLGGRALC